MKQDLARDGSFGTERQDKVSRGRVGMGSQGSSGGGLEAQGLERTGLAGAASRGADGFRPSRHGAEAQATGAPSGAPTYKIRDGARVPKKHAADLASAMVALTREGRGTPEALVESAADESSPIHQCFEWNDKSAAHAYRVEQARHYWKAIEIVVRVDDSTESKQRAFHPVFIDGERQYQDIGTIAQSQSLMAQLVDQAKRDLIAFKHRYASLNEAAELAAVFAAIDALGGKDAA